MTNETKELLLRYKELISKKISCPLDDIKFYMEVAINEGSEFETFEYKEIGELYYSKPDMEYFSDTQCYSIWSKGNYKITRKISEEREDIISTFRLYELPHCCAYMVSCRSEVYPDYRMKGVGKILNCLRQDIGRLLNYSAILCTDIKTNIAQRKILKDNNWEDVHQIVNKRTKNLVYLSVKNL